MKPLHTVVEQQIDNYISEEITITDAYQFSQYKTIQQIEHSKFTLGQFDSRGNPKPFFNITKGKVNIAIRAIDIDRKDIKIKETHLRRLFPFLSRFKIRSEAHEEDAAPRLSQ